MNSNELVNVFSKYGLIPDNPLKKEEALNIIDEDEELDIIAHELLAEYASDQSISLLLGDCVDEDVIEEFVDNFEMIKEMSGGKVAVSDLKVSPEIGSKIEGQEITISFTWNDKRYEF